MVVFSGTPRRAFIDLCGVERRQTNRAGDGNKKGLIGP